MAADFDFHREIARSAHNPLLLMMLDAVSDPLMEIRRVTFGLPGHLAAGIRAHHSILAPVLAHDPQGAREAMTRHLSTARSVCEVLDAPFEDD